jgi:hypothetical protein
MVVMVVVVWASVVVKMAAIGSNAEVVVSDSVGIKVVVSLLLLLGLEAFGLEAIGVKVEGISA